MNRPGWQLPSTFQWLQFAAVVAVFFVFGTVAFYRVLGILGAAYAVAGTWSGKIPVGIRGRPPSFYLTGATAIVVGLLVTAACLALAWFAPEAACYFSKGRECP